MCHYVKCGALRFAPPHICSEDSPTPSWLQKHRCLLMRYIHTGQAPPGCASGCVVECRICNREVAGSNLSLGYFAPRYTQPSIPPESVNEYQLQLGRQRQVWLIPIADERVGVQVKLWNPLRTRATPERFCGGDSLRRGAISSVCTFTFTSPLPQCLTNCVSNVSASGSRHRLS